MIRKSAILVLLVFAFACLSLAAAKSFTGTVSDSNCGAKHAKSSAAAAECVEKCVSSGGKYVLVSKGKVYQVDDQDKFKGMGGKSVKVSGTLSGDTITVASVTPAGGM